MTVIAMTREMGSRGKDVALALAEELGLHIVQHELAEHVAQRLDVDARSVNHFLEGTASFFERWGINANDLSLRTTEEILDLAEQGNVLFRGWGATHVLSAVPHAVCVRVCARMDARVDELMTRVGLPDQSRALAEIRNSDEAHERALAGLFNASWDDPLVYDAVFNLGRMSVATCAGQIKALVASEEYAPTKHSLGVLRHMQIEARVRAALRASPNLRKAGPSFEASVDRCTGEVTLRGVVVDYAFKQEAEDLIRNIDGVNGVVDEMWVPQMVGFGP